MTPPKRGDRVDPPRGRDDAASSAEGAWDLLFGNNGAAGGWQEVCRHAPGPAHAAWIHMVTTPRKHDHRHHQLRGHLAVGDQDGRRMERWQIEVTGAGRVWYLIDDELHKVWLVRAGMAHPKETER